jgi:hypothetical protein
MAYIHTLFGKKIEVENKVSLALIKQYEDRFPGDEEYVFGKAEEIKSVDMATALMAWFNLDQKGKEALANNLDMDFDMLSNTCEGIKLIVNN